MVINVLVGIGGIAMGYLVVNYILNKTKKEVVEDGVEMTAREQLEDIFDDYQAGCPSYSLGHCKLKDSECELYRCPILYWKVVEISEKEGYDG